jgi:hypothetical protein
MPERRRSPSPDEPRARLTERRARLADLEARGSGRHSRYDIAIAHGGDAAQAMATATWLVGNHIAYSTRQLEPCEAGPQQRNVFAQLDHGPADDQEDSAITTP